MTFWHDYIDAVWGPRPERPEALAARFSKLIDRLALIDPAFGNWLWLDANKEVTPFVGIRHCLAKEIAARVTRGDDGEPEPVYGYWMSAFNSLEDTPRSLSLSVQGGCRVGGVGHANMATINTAWKMEPDPIIANHRVFRAALLACAECFDATFGVAFPTNVMDLWPANTMYRFGWINYVAPRFAPLVTPPTSAIVEYRPDGGLLMSATDDVFSVNNPQHMAVAQVIQAALAPLNALPWPPDAEPQGEKG